MISNILRRVASVFSRRPAGRMGLEESTAEKEESEGDLSNPFSEPVVVEFSDDLDLHSIPPKLVRAVVEDYLAEARRRRVRWVRIIHGKGVGVQREAVRSLLSSTGFVVEFSDAPPEAGGWGATIVTLDSQTQ